MQTWNEEVRLNGLRDTLGWPEVKLQSLVEQSADPLARRSRDGARARERQVWIYGAKSLIQDTDPDAWKDTMTLSSSSDQMTTLSLLSVSAQRSASLLQCARGPSPGRRTCPDQVDEAVLAPGVARVQVMSQPHGLDTRVSTDRGHVDRWHVASQPPGSLHPERMEGTYPVPP